MTSRVDAEVAAVLADAEWDGLVMHINRELDRGTYVTLNKAIEALGGKWNRRRRGHVFERADAPTVVAAFAQSGEYIDPKKEFQLFETPAALAAEMAGLVSHLRSAEARALEPSAGSGRLIRALLDDGWPRHAIDAIELDSKHHDTLRSLVDTVLPGDFLTYGTGSYDAIVMNPPFAKQADIIHVGQAFGSLDPGGRLVAVTSPGWTFREDKRSRAFRQLVDDYGSSRPIPAGTFKASGTMVSACLVVLDR